MRRTIIGLVASVLVVGLLPAAALAPGAGAQPADCDSRVNDTPELLMECATVDGARVHQQALQEIADANGGNREASSPGYDASVDYVAGLMEGWGYDVTVQDFEFPYFEIVGDPVFEQTAPVATEYEETADFDVMTFSGAGDVTAPVQPVDIDLDDRSAGSGCEAADFVGFTAGNVALIQRGGCDFVVKVGNAEDAGAVGAIVFNQGNEDPASDRFGVVLGTLGSPGVEIPAIGISFALGEELATASAATVHIDVDTISEVRSSKNVLADKPGGDPNNVVVLGAHLDSVQEGPGINDNGSGSSGLLEVAEQFKNVTPTNTVRFAWWGAEEGGLNGSNFYIADISDEEFEKLALYLNFDMIASPNYVRFVYDGDGDTFGLAGPPGSDAVEELFEDFHRGRGLAWEPTQIDFRSDYAAFFDSGVPFGGLFTGAEDPKTAEQAAVYGGTEGEWHDPCYHQACDTFENVSLEVFDLNLDAIANALATYAASTLEVDIRTDVLLVAGSSPPPAPDAAVVSIVEDAGYDVTVVDDDALTMADVEAAGTVLVSSSVVPATIPAWLADVARPLGTWEGHLFDDLGLATQAREVDSAESAIRMDPANADHPLAAGFTGKPAVFDGPAGKLNMGLAGPDATVIAREASGAQRPVYFAYAEGDPMADASPAPDDRLAFFATYDNIGRLKGAGREMLTAAVYWLLGTT